MTHDPLCPYTPEHRTKCTHGMDADGGYSIESITTDVCQALHYWPGTPCECDFIAEVRADQDKRGQEYSRGWRAGYGEGRQDAAMDVKDELRHGPNPHIMLACMPPMPACTGCARGWPHPVDPVARAAGKPANHNRLPTSDAKGHDL